MKKTLRNKPKNVNSSRPCAGEKEITKNNCGDNDNNEKVEYDSAIFGIYGFS